jgi:hypothetical protein
MKKGNKLRSYERVWGEVVEAYFPVISWHEAGWTGKIEGNHQ